MKIKRVLAINDISCVGRCSLTVALPLISGAGIETSILPTAVLSTHTGGFSGYTLCDLNDEILPISNHWKSLGIKFDMIYSGYLASIAQIDNVLKTINMFKDDKNMLVCDPAMADNGKLYACFDLDFVSEMARIVRVADVSLPNITEACFLTGTEYKDKTLDKEYYINLMDKLVAMGSKNVCLTGVSLHEGMLGFGCFVNGKPEFYEEELIPYMFHGTGDVFASAFVSALTLGKSIYDAGVIAVKVTREAILKTIDSSTDSKFGVNFELAIPLLNKLVNNE